MKHGIDVNFKRFAMVLTNKASKVCGVLNAFSAFSEIYIVGASITRNCKE